MCILLYGEKSKEYVPKKLFSYFSTKTYVVGTQKNRLNEKHVIIDGYENIYNSLLKKSVYQNLL